MEKKYNIQEITLLPARNNTLDKVTETDPTYTMIDKCPLGDYTPEEGDHILPIFVGPDIDIVNVDSAPRFLKAGVTPIIPVEVPVCYRVDLSAKGWWVAWTPGEFIEAFAEPFAEDETPTAINPCGYTRVYIQTPYGNSDKLQKAVADAKLQFDDRIVIMVSGVSTPQTYKDWCNEGADFVEVDDRYYPMASLLTEIMDIKLTRIDRSKYCSACVARVSDTNVMPEMLACGADYVICDREMFRNCMEIGAKFRGQHNWEGITHIETDVESIKRYAAWLNEELDRWMFPGIKEYIKSLPDGEYSWVDLKGHKDYTPVSSPTLYDVDDTAVDVDITLPETGGFDISDDGCCGDVEGDKFVCGCVNGEHCDDCDCHPDKNPDTPEDPDVSTGVPDIQFPDDLDPSFGVKPGPDVQIPDVLDPSFGITPEQPDIQFPDVLDPSFGVTPETPEVQIPDILDPGFTKYPEVLVPDDLDPGYTRPEDWTSEKKSLGMTYPEIVKLITLLDFRKDRHSSPCKVLIGIRNMDEFWNMSEPMKKAFIHLFNTYKVGVKEHPKGYNSVYYDVKYTLKGILNDFSRKTRHLMFFLGCKDIHTFINTQHDMILR